MVEHCIELPDPFPSGARKLAFVDGHQILIFNVAGTLHAVENSCPHAGGSLASGKLEGAMLRCPSHGLRFDVTGKGLGNSGLQLRSYPIEYDGAAARIVIA